MARVLSAFVLLPLVFGTIWFLPPVATLVLAEVVLVIAFFEYAGLATALGARVPRGLVVVGVAAVAAGVPYDVTEVVLVASALVVSVLSLTTARRDGQALLDIGSSLFPLLYLGLPIGAEIFIAKASRELVISFNAGNHQHLLVLLRGLRQSVELTGIEATGHEEFASPLGGAFEKHGGLDFEKTVLVEESAGRLTGVVA